MSAESARGAKETLRTLHRCGSLHWVRQNQTLKGKGRCSACHAIQSRAPILCALCENIEPAGLTGLCVHCYNPARNFLRELLAPYPHLAPLGHLWLTLPKAGQSIGKWVYANADLLRAFCALPATHETLDALPFATIAVRVLRHALEQCGVLEPRLISYNELLRYVREQCKKVQSADRGVLLSYFQFWFVPAQRRRRDFGEHVDPNFAEGRSRTRQLVKFSQDLERRGTTLTAFTQENLSEIPCDLERLGPFIRWLNRSRSRRHKLKIRRDNSGKSPRKPLNLDTLWSLIARALNDTTLPVMTRLVVIFAAMYAQRRSNIARIHRCQLSADLTKIRFGDVWLTVPEPIPELLRQQFADRPVRDPENPWLFPSAIYAGQPTQSNVLRDRVSRSLGMPFNDIHVDAIVALLRGVEPPMLARMLGMNMATTLHWAELCESPSWDQMLRMRRDLEHLPAPTITIADRVAAEYGGRTLTNKKQQAEVLPILRQTSLSDEEFEDFAYQRVENL